MESFCTDFRGLIRWMPSPITSPVTLPNKVRTPTLPVGIEVTLASSRIRSSATPRIFSSRLRNPAKPGMPLKPPLMSTVRPVLVIGVSIRYGIFGCNPFVHLARDLRLRPILRIPVKPMHYGHSRSEKTVCENPQLSATMPPYLVWFFLDTTLANAPQSPASCCFLAGAAEDRAGH